MPKMERREYLISPILINGSSIQKLVIDPHIDKHADHIDDELVKEIVAHLNGGHYRPVDEEDGFSYFATMLKHSGSWYKLVWLLEDEKLYIGVITVFKDRRIK